MKSINTQKKSDVLVPGKQRSYNEVVEYLDLHWNTNQNDLSLTVAKQLDKAFDSVSQKLNTILITGSNGKSLTAHFTTKILCQEGLSVGTLYTPHILTYNERIAVNNTTIANKAFTDLGNEVINMVEMLGLQANSSEILTMMGLLYFKNSNTSVVIIEVGTQGAGDAANICTPKISAITRVIHQKEGADASLVLQQENENLIEQMLAVVRPGTYVISADQSKFNLQAMQDRTVAKGGVWAMPIRKLAPLQYPFEQLHGRCAALAERIAHIFINSFADHATISDTSSLLTKQMGHRGRPTLEAKRQSELNPKKTVEQFWKETLATLPGRFQLLDKEKPTILLDSASNLDAFKNILLGIRLLHYNRPLKGLTLILGCNNPELDVAELLKLLRYFFKKTSGQIIICPVAPTPGHPEAPEWNVEKVANNIRSMKLKAKSAANLKEAFELAQKSVDDRHGLVVITGSSALITEYWKNKGIKKI